jgi:CubicO group peptidase (beta-lactamase class C family)
MNKEMVFEIGSMTKQFTATAIMMLVEEGKVGLDDKVSKYFPEIPTAWNSITVRNLLTHTSGIDGDSKKADKSCPADSPEYNVKIGANCYKLVLHFPPGKAWAYSNSGFGLLGLIVQKASGKSCAEFVEQRILKPVGMLNGHVSVRHGIMANRVAGYEWKNGRLENRTAMYNVVGDVGDVGINSTVGDLAKWDAALYTNNLLKRSTLEQMWTPLELQDGAPAFGYGFGWFIETFHGHRIIHHAGLTPGFSSSISRFADDKLTVIVLTNCAQQVADVFARDIAALYLPDLTEGKQTTTAPDAHTSQILQTALTGMMSGKPDLTLFTPAMQSFLKSDTGDEFSQWIAYYGALKSFSFSDGEESGNERVLHYKTALGDHTFTFVFRVTQEGKIAHAFFW